MTNVFNVYLDLSQPFDTDQIPRVDAIVTLAQERAFRDFPKRASETASVNISANLRIWEWASRTDVRKLIHASSGGVYGLVSNEPMIEATSTIPLKQPTFYLSTKLCAEIVFNSFSHLFESTSLLRPFFLYGPNQDPLMFMQRIIERVRTGSAVEITSQGGFRFNPIYVDDAVNSFINALELDGHHIINCAGPTEISLRQMCELVGQIIGNRPNYIIVNQRVVDFVADTSQQTRLLGAPVTTLEYGLQRAVLTHN